MDRALPSNQIGVPIPANMIRDANCISKWQVELVVRDRLEMSDAD